MPLIVSVCTRVERRCRTLRVALIRRLPVRRGTTTRGLWRSLVSALDWGSRGPGFKSRQPDKKCPWRHILRRRPKRLRAVGATGCNQYRYPRSTLALECPARRRALTRPPVASTCICPCGPLRASSSSLKGTSGSALALVGRQRIRTAPATHGWQRFDDVGGAVALELLASGCAVTPRGALGA